MIGELGRRFLSQHREPAVDMGRTARAEYTMTKWKHVNDSRIEQMVERLIAELVSQSSAPGAEPASTLGLICGVQHEDGRIIVTFSLCNSGKDQGCH